MAHDAVAGAALDRTTKLESALTALDPRTRIVMAFAFAVVVVSLQTLAALTLALVLAVLTAWQARLPWRSTRKTLLTMDGFVLAMLVMLPFTTPGPTIATIGPLTMSSSGLHLATTIALKANAIVLMLLALVGSLEPALLGHALRRLGVPMALVQLLFFTVRYIEVLGTEYLRLRTAMRARAFKAACSLHTLRTFGYLVGMLVVRASERAERVLQAMRCRGFNGTFPVLLEPALRRHDGVAGVMAVALLASLVLVERTIV